MNNNIFNIIINDTKNIFIEKKFKFLKNKSILITGATGILGNYMIGFFLNALQTRNNPKKITIIYKKSLPKYLNFLNTNKKFLLIQKDLSSVNNINIRKQDYIIHLAGYGQPLKFMKDQLKTFNLNTAVVQFLLKKLNKNGSFLYLSSSEVYSGLSGNVTERNIGCTNTNHPRSCYIESKKGGETIVNIFRNNYGLDAKSARLCLAYGPGTKKNDQRVLNQFVERGLKNKIITMQDNGTAIRSYIYLADAAKILLDILFFGKFSVYNVGGKEKISIKNLAKKIGRLLKVPVKLSSQNFSNKIGAPKNANVSIDLYEKEFKKIKLKSLNEGLIKTIQWQKKIYNK